MFCVALPALAFPSIFKLVCFWPVQWYDKSITLYIFFAL